MTPIYLYGCGGHSKVILDILLNQGRSVTGILDDAPHPDKSAIYGVPVYQAEALLPGLKPGESEWIVSIGNNKTRQKIVAQLQQLGHGFTTAIHPSAQIGRGVAIAPGSVVMANAVINCDSQIGQHVIVNTGATIDHDCVIGDYSHIAPGCTLCGHVSVGVCCFLCVGTKVIPCVTIDDYTTCPAGMIVTPHTLMQSRSAVRHLLKHHAQ